MIDVKPRRDNQLGVFAACDFDSGEIIKSIEVRETSRFPDRFSIQVEEDHHFNPEEHPFGRLNHSCAPNATMEWSKPTLAVRALQAIAEGDEVTFDYLTTETQMAEPFSCSCGSEHCRGDIRGSSFSSSGR